MRAATPFLPAPALRRGRLAVPMLGALLALGVFGAAPASAWMDVNANKIDDVIEEVNAGGWNAAFENGDPKSFDSGRRYASFLGITPREFSSGEKRYLGRISKRGDRYIRMLLTHGARSLLHSATVAQRAGRPVDRLKAWALAVQARTNHNKATCALANKLARIAWAVWHNDVPYHSAAAA